MRIKILISVLCLAGAAHPEPPAAFSAASSLKLAFGYDDNADARPDEPEEGGKRRGDAFWLLKPTAVLTRGMGRFTVARLECQAALEKFRSETRNDSLTGSLTAAVTKDSRAASCDLAVSLVRKDLRNLRDETGRRVLDYRAGRAAMAVELKPDPDRRWAFRGNGGLARTTYPDSAVVTSPLRPDVPADRAAWTGSGRAGLSFRAARGWASAVQYQFARSRCNALELQQGEYRDRFSYRSHGPVLSANATLAPSLRWEAAVQCQKRLYDERTPPGTASPEHAGVLAAAINFTWQRDRHAALTLEYAYFRYASDDSRRSFGNSRLALGLLLTRETDL